MFQKAAHMRPNSQQLRAFAHAVREGSFSRAAVRMGISQSAVSQHLAKLEQIAGTKLLFRGSVGLTLTKAGQEFYELADRLLTLDALIDEKVSGYSTSEAGYLNVIANAPHPALFLIGRFRARYPGIEIDFSLCDWTAAMGLLRSRQADIGIVTAPDRIGSCHRVKFRTQRFVAFMRPENALAAQRHVTLAQMAAETLLLPEPGSLTERVVKKKLAEHHVTASRVMRTHTFPVMVEAILHGVGVGIFLEDSIYPNPELIARPIAEMPESYSTEIVCPADKRDLRIVGDFLDMASSVQLSHSPNAPG